MSEQIQDGATFTTGWIEFMADRKPEDDAIYQHPHRYRIEVKKIGHGHWMQRHIWQWNDGRERIEEWIKSFDQSRKLDNYTPVEAQAA